MILVALSLIGYVFAVRLPSLGSDLRLYTTFGAYFNENGRLPAVDQVIGSDSFIGTYADFPALSLRVYQVLAHGGDIPNKFVWAAYFLIPLTLVLIGVARWGSKLGLSIPSARALSLVGLVMGIWTARFYEDKAHFLWLPLLVFLLASMSAFAGALATGLFSGWTGLLPLSPFLASVRRPRHKVMLFLSASISAGLVLLSAGSSSIQLLRNRAERESGETFWFGFWRYLPLLDQSAIRLGIALLLSLLALIAFQRRWLSLPAAMSSSAFFLVTSSSSFQHTRIWMLLPLAVFLLPTVRSQVVYLAILLGWSCIPLIDFLGYGYVFAGSGISHVQEVLLSLFTNIPVLFFYGAFTFALLRGIRLHLGKSATLFEPNAGNFRITSSPGGNGAELPTQQGA